MDNQFNSSPLLCVLSYHLDYDNAAAEANNQDALAASNCQVHRDIARPTESPAKEVVKVLVVASTTVLTDSTS